MASIPLSHPLVLNNPTTMTTNPSVRTSPANSGLSVAFDEKKPYVIVPNWETARKRLKLPSSVDFGLQLEHEEGAQSGQMKVTIMAIRRFGKPVRRIVVWRQGFERLKMPGMSDLRENETFPYPAVRGAERMLLFQALNMVKESNLRVMEGADHRAAGLYLSTIVFELDVRTPDYRYHETCELPRAETEAFYRAFGVRVDDGL